MNKLLDNLNWNRADLPAPQVEEVQLTPDEMKRFCLSGKPRTEYVVSFPCNGKQARFQFASPATARVFIDMYAQASYMSIFAPSITESAQEQEKLYILLDNYTGMTEAGPALLAEIEKAKSEMENELGIFIWSIKEVVRSN